MQKYIDVSQLAQPWRERARAVSRASPRAARDALLRCGDAVFVVERAASERRSRRGKRVGSSVSVSTPYRVQQRCSFLSAFDAVSSPLSLCCSSVMQLWSERTAS